jgi:hypothetical protein
MSEVLIPAQGPIDVNVSRQCTCHPDDNPPTPCEHRYAFRDCANASEERYLHEMIAMLQESYAKAAKPYVDRLAAIYAMRPPAPMIVPVEQAQALGLMPKTAPVTYTRPASSRLPGSPCARCNLEAEIDRLRQICRDAYEVWAGSEGIPVPETAPEAYLLQLLTQMRDEVKKGL